MRLSRSPPSTSCRLPAVTCTGKRMMAVGRPQGCIDMYNATIGNFKLHLLGVCKERLGQSVLVAAMREVSKTELRGIYICFYDRGAKFVAGANAEPDLTDKQIYEQLNESGALGYGRVRRQGRARNLPRVGRAGKSPQRLTHWPTCSIREGSQRLPQRRLQR